MASSTFITVWTLRSKSAPPARTRRQNASVQGSDSDRFNPASCCKNRGVAQRSTANRLLIADGAVTVCAHGDVIGKGETRTLDSGTMGAGGFRNPGRIIGVQSQIAFWGPDRSHREPAEYPLAAAHDRDAVADG